MRSFIRMIALAILIATSLFWYTQGARTGWTQRVPSVARVEPITGIEISEKIPQIIPGIDFLVGSVAVVVFLFVISSRRRRPTEQLVPFTEPATGEPEVASTDPETETEPVESGTESGPDDSRANRLT